MVRQSADPVTFNRGIRGDNGLIVTSLFAGKVTPVSYVPIYPGDSASGSIGVDGDLAHMPKPLLNGVVANVQTWFVPKASLPQFSGPDEFLASFQETTITALGQTDRTPPPLYETVSAQGDLDIIAASEFFLALGLHIPPNTVLNTDLIDSFWRIYNFRLAAHSSKLQLKGYTQDSVTSATTLPQAFWPQSRSSRFVPDYELALVIGELALDVTAGQLPVFGISRTAADEAANNANIQFNPTNVQIYNAVSDRNIQLELSTDGSSNIFSDMAGQTVVTSLADIDKARTTQAFAKLMTAYAGQDSGGYGISENAMVAHLMQGLVVPPELFNRPWLLDSAQVPIGFSERHATDGASLEQSTSQGAFSTRLSVNLPTQDSGGVIITTVELLPERVQEAQSDEWLHYTKVGDLPNALRDIQRVEPVDTVTNRRLDVRHTSPDGLYGYEPMNDVHDRETTRLGGIFHQPDPSNPFKEARSALWLSALVDPIFTEDHWLCPKDFNQDVFSDPLAPCAEISSRHTISIVGLTQRGDPLAEDNSEYERTDETGDETP